MKMLLCQDCLALVVPNYTDGIITWCRCGRHAVWWANGEKGELRVYDTRRETDAERSVDGETRTTIYPKKAYVIGLSNAILSEPTDPLTPELIQELIDYHPDSYLFKRLRSLVVRLRPGSSSDTAYAATLPGRSK